MMKKKFLPVLLFVIAALLTAGYAVRLYADYVTVYEFGSAPFWFYMAEWFIPFMLPAIGCLIAGIALRKRNK